MFRHAERAPSYASRPRRLLPKSVGGDRSGDLLDCAFVTYSPGAKQKCQYRRRGFVPSGTQCYAWAFDGAGGRESVSRRSDVSHKRIGKHPTMAVRVSSKNG